GIPVVGTMAHSFIQAHDLETEAFRHFAQCHPNNLVLLIDTYDTRRGAQRVVELASELRTRGVRVRGVRIDSGDLAAEARAVRDILKAAGIEPIRTFLSVNLDEHEIETLERVVAPFDAYFIGTRVDVSADAPALDCAYKLQE